MDDTILLATSKERLAQLLRRVSKTCMKLQLSMEMNRSKTKVVVTGGKKIQLDQRILFLECVNEFVYLCNLLRDTTNKRRVIWCDREVARNTLKVWSLSSVFSFLLAPSCG